MPPPEALYRAAAYCIEQPGRQAVELRVDHYAPGLVALYREHGADCMAFVTACNPEGLINTPSAGNEAAMAKLRGQVRGLGLVALPGTGRDGNPTSDWPGEASLAVFGLGVADAEALGRAYRQNAIAWAGPDAVPRLLMLRQVGAAG